MGIWSGCGRRWFVISSQNMFPFCTWGGLSEVEKVLSRAAGVTETEANGQKRGIKNKQTNRKRRGRDKIDIPHTWIHWRVHTQAAACSTADETFTALGQKYCPDFQLLSPPSSHLSCHLQPLFSCFIDVPGRKKNRPYIRFYRRSVKDIYKKLFPAAQINLADLLSSPLPFFSISGSASCSWFVLKHAQTILQSLQIPTFAVPPTLFCPVSHTSSPPPLKLLLWKNNLQV